MKLLTKFNPVQLINSPRSTTATTKTIIIDHIITNRSESVSKSGVLSCSISDHDAAFMTKHIRLPKLIKTFKTSFNYRSSGSGQNSIIPVVCDVPE